MRKVVGVAGSAFETGLLDSPNLSNFITSLLGMYNLEVGILGRQKLRETRGKVVYFGKRFGIGKTWV